MIPGSLNTMLMGGDSDVPPVILDTFTDTNGTQLTAHTPDISPSSWVNASIGETPSTNALITANKAYLSVDNSAAVIESNQSDCVIEVDWTPGAGGTDRNSIIFRYQDASNMLFFNIRDPNGDCQVVTFQAGVSTVVSNTLFSWTGGVEYHIAVELSGSSIICKIDGTTVITTSNAFQTTITKHGIGRNTGSNDHRFDNFKITV